MKTKLDSGRKVFYYAYLNNTYDEKLNKLILTFNEKKYIKLYITHSWGIDKNYFLDYILNENDPSYIYDIWFSNKEYLPSTGLFIKKLIELKSERYILLMLYNLQIVQNIYLNDCIELEKEYFNISNADSINQIIKTSFENSRNKYKIDCTGFTTKCYKGHNNQIPFLIVCHISNMYEKIIYNFYDETSDVSSHFVIGINGEIKQVVSLDDSSWANGTSQSIESDAYYKFAKSEFVKNNPVNANYYTFSIEHESMDGSLTDKEYNSSLKAMIQIIDYLKNKYNYDFIIDREHIIGHNDVNPIVRTKCPGEKFPFNQLINDLKKHYNRD